MNFLVVFECKQNGYWETVILGHSNPTLAGIMLAHNQLLLFSWLVVTCRRADDKI